MCGQGWATGDHPRDSERSKGKARSDLVARASIDQGGAHSRRKSGAANFGIGILCLPQTLPNKRVIACWRMAPMTLPRDDLCLISWQEEGVEKFAAQTQKASNQSLLSL